MNYEMRESREMGARIKILGRYTATDLQLAMRVVLARAHLRALRSAPPINCDVKSNGRMIAL